MRHIKTTQSAAGFLRAAIDLLLPPRCIGTGDIVAAPDMISPAFWKQLAFIEKPFCITCGTPFGFETEENALCGGCLEKTPDFDTARSAVVYNDASRQIVLDFKYGDKLHAVHTFTHWLSRAGGALIEKTDVIIPVPLHRRRLWQRRFNQSAILSQRLAQASGKPCLLAGLARTRHTLPQKGLSRTERKNNIRNAFAVNTSAIPEIMNRNVLLIDDVFTSGATLNECARVLKKAGAARVFVLTIARATREEFS